MKSFPNMPHVEGNVCPLCGGYKTKDAALCVKCHVEYTHRYKPSREKLKFMIRYMPFTKIGAKHDVSAATVKVWCQQYGLPHLKRDINQISDEEWENI